jgi:UDP-N-acetyl-D-mannosaminuronate dehydrogenase
MKVAMIGCGKLGLPCAEVMAEYNDVIGYGVILDPWRTLQTTNTYRIIHYGNTRI